DRAGAGASSPCVHFACGLEQAQPHETSTARRSEDRGRRCAEVALIKCDSKLIVSWLIGGRDAGYAREVVTDVAARLANRVQLTTDGHGAYLAVVGDAFRGEVDYAQLVKVYGPDPREDQRRYSPVQCLGAVRKPRSVTRTRTTSARRSWSAAT